MISLRWHRMSRTSRRNARAKWLPVPRQGRSLVPDEFAPLLMRPEGRPLVESLDRDEFDAEFGNGGFFDE